jgi:hypothetical protein
MSPLACSELGAVDDHFAGRLSPARERELRAHATGCSTCRTRYQRHLRLEKLDPRALGFEERLRRGLGLARPAYRPPLWAWTAVAGVLALGGLLLLPGLPGRQAKELDGVRARGAGSAAAPLVLVLDDRGTEVAGFRTSGPEAPAPLTDRIGRSDELAFAYRNGGGWPMLMIFARDEAGGVYWFSPQWTDPAADPAAIDLKTEPGPHELPAAVAHDFKGRSLLLCALASHERTSTRRVEAALAGLPQRSPAEILAGPDRAIACRPIEVAP